jgi:hypothetical protein
MQENSIVTAEASDDGEYLSRSTDHLANMASQLADLIGYPVLAYELIQNADDGGAELLSFRVLEDRLEVWNDKPFTDCGSNADNCPQDPRCDFHSFRLVGSGNKAGRSETTGKFGIGFTAVYQITDHPKLISAGRHWILDEAAVGAENLCHQAILVNHAPGAVATPDAEVVQVGNAIWQRAEWRGLVQGAVGPARVVEVLVLAQDGQQVALVPDQGPV